MNEYKDRQVWFELWGFDGFRWEFIADFETKEDAVAYDGPALDLYDYSKVRPAHNET